MTVSDAITLTNEVAEIASQLNEELASGQPESEVLREVYSLRQSVERLERELRGAKLDALGDAC